jgi:hypothetical protein
MEPANDNQCLVGASLTMEKTYNGTFKSTNDSDWAYVDIGSTMNLQITAANVPTPSQLQVYVTADGKCTSISGVPSALVVDKANPSVTLSGLSGGRIYVRLVAVTMATNGQRYTLRISPNPTTGSFEENDTPCQAMTALTNTTYITYGDDNYDFFELNVPTTGTLNMVLGADMLSQLDLRSPLTDTNCHPTRSTRALMQTSTVNNPAPQIAYFAAVPGRYYARIYVANEHIPNPARAYTFRWTLTPGARLAKVCVGNGSSIDGCIGDAENNSSTVKWQGLNGNARIRLEFIGSGGAGSAPNQCMPGSRPPIEFTTKDIDGVRTVGQIPNGGYRVEITVIDASSGALLYSNAQSLEMGCQIRPAVDVQALPELKP